MFDSFIMWVRVQGSPCHIAAGSNPVQEAGGHKIVYTMVKFKSCFNVVKNHQPPTNSACYNDSEKKYSLTYTTYRFVVIEEKVRGQKFWLYRDQTGQNTLILLAMVSKCSSGEYNSNSE